MKDDGGRGNTHHHLADRGIQSEEEQETEGDEDAYDDELRHNAAIHRQPSDAPNPRAPPQRPTQKTSQQSRLWNSTKQEGNSSSVSAE